MLTPYSLAHESLHPSSNGIRPVSPLVRRLHEKRRVRGFSSTGTPSRRDTRSSTGSPSTDKTAAQTDRGSQPVSLVYAWTSACGADSNGYEHQRTFHAGFSAEDPLIGGALVDYGLLNGFFDDTISSMGWFAIASLSLSFLLLWRFRSAALR